MKKNYRKIEAMLYNYKKTKCEIKNITLEIDDLENNYKGINPISYEEKTSSSNLVSSIVECEIINKEEKEEYLRRLKSNKQLEVIKIENALECLDEREKKIVELRYFEKISNMNVAIMLDLTEQHLSTIKTKAIKSLINSIILK